MTVREKSTMRDRERERASAAVITMTLPLYHHSGVWAGSGEFRGIPPGHGHAPPFPPSFLPSPPLLSTELDQLNKPALPLSPSLFISPIKTQFWYRALSQSAPSSKKASSSTNHVQCLANASGVLFPRYT